MHEFVGPMESPRKLAASAWHLHVIEAVTCKVEIELLGKISIMNYNARAVKNLLHNK
jgi:hypothetical protein